MRFSRVFAALSLAALVTGTAKASGVDPTRISLPKGPGSIEGLGRSFSPSLSSGTASYGVSIAVPPGVNGFVPDLSLDYDSGGGVSDVGLGWSLSKLPKIRRRTDNGLPKFTDADPFEITGMGIPSDLLEVSPGVFRPQYESGAFVRVKRSADGSSWEARDKSGTTYRFGGDGFVEAEGSHVAAFLLRETLDLFGHKISYTWDTTSAGHGVLTRVVYNDFSATARNEVLFTYEARPDAHTRFSAGIKETLDRRLTKIEVKHGGALVRRYDLTYAPGGHSRLATVTMVGSDGVTSLPTLSLQYAEASFASDGQITTMTTPPGRTPADANVDLADLDGDGLPDLLVTKAGQYRTYVNHDGKKWNAPIDWSASPSLELGSTGVQLADVNGDGAIDLLAKSGTASLRYFPGATASSFGAALAITTVPNFTFEDPDVRLADMDGDRRTDAVITTAAGLAIGYNLNGTDWTTPTTIGVVDPTQPLRFSDGHTQLCDVNGDRIQDLCYFRPGGLVYYLGRGRGRFEPAVTASGVPDFDPSAPYQLVDLDGDGWVDLLRVGVTQVEYALATGAGVFGPVKSIGAVPTKGPNTTVRLADMNGSGTTDVVWIDVSGAPDQAWKYLELFPSGRGGLLRTIDNGLGKKVSITYSSSALEAAAARDAGKPWTTRMNLSMPVVKRVEIDDGLGDPVMATEYTYRDGTYSPDERTFAAFAGGTDKEIGDAYTPTLLTNQTFDPGLGDRTQRGLVLTSEDRDEKGYIFGRSSRSYTTKAVGKGLDGRAITYTFASAEQVEHIEGTDTSKERITLTEWEQDDWGNVTAEKRWGEVVAGNKLAGNDEAISLRTYAQDLDEWVLGHVATSELQDGRGKRVRMERSYYDGEAFTGLGLGKVTRGTLTRKEGWVGPEGENFVLVAGLAYDDDGNPIESKDAIGGGRRFEWNADNRSFVDRETIVTGGYELVSVASYDAGTGALLSFTARNGQVTSWGYDPLARLTTVVRSGDTWERPTERYAYLLGAPLSRVTTDARVWSGRDDVEHSEVIYDGLGRSRAGFANDDDGRIVLGGVSFYDARGKARRALRERFVAEAERAAPPLSTDGAGEDVWRDAAGRALRTRTQLGIETKHSYEPLSTARWDGAQSDVASPYEHTPVVEGSDGLGRLVTRSQTLEGKPVTTTIALNAAGEMLSRTDPEGNVSSYEYDGLGRRTTIHDPDLGLHTFVFDDLGNMLEHHKPGGVVTKATYDKASRLVTEDWDGDGKLEVVRTYDADPANPGDLSLRGELYAATWPGGSTTRAYDERQRVVRTTFAYQGTSYGVGGKYDAQDRPYLYEYPDGSSIRVQRSARGLITGYGKAITFAYDADGREMRRTFNTGVVEMNGYDDDRRRTENVAKRPDGSVIQHLKWTLDGSDNILSVRDLRAGIDAAHDRSETYGYDNLYRLSSATGTWGKTTWKFSPSGNLVDRTSTEASQHAGLMTYGAGAGPHALTGFKGRTIAYDARGRMKDDGERAYTWDDGEHLTRVTAKSGASMEAIFDDGGARRVRIERSAAGESHTTFFLDAWSEVRDGQLQRYIVHGGQRVARLSDKNGAPAATGKGSAALSAEPPRARSGTTNAQSGAPASLMHLGLGASPFFIALALLAALASFYRRQLLAFGRYAAPIVGFGALLMLSSATGCGHEAPPKEPPIEDGTVQVLSEEDDILFDDQIGSLTETTSGSGTSKASSATYAFGLTRYDTSSETRKFANTPRDEGVGLDQMGARSYAPELGVWTSGDPIALKAPSRQADASDVGNGNAYAYAAGRPLTHVDRDGHAAQALLLFNPVVILDAALVTGAVVVTVAAVDYARTHPITISSSSTNLMGGATQVIARVNANVTAKATTRAGECTESAPSASNQGSKNNGSGQGNSPATAPGTSPPAKAQGAPPKSGETPATSLGRQKHKEWKPGSGYKKEVRLDNGKQADAVNFEKRHVKELKPDNPRAVQRGERQVKGYVEQLEKQYPTQPGQKPWTGCVETYKK
jgi:RHS repeat-associated protein